MICPLQPGGNLEPGSARSRSGADDETTRCFIEGHAKKISWASAAEIIGVTPRTMRRWRPPARFEAQHKKEAAARRIA